MKDVEGILSKVYIKKDIHPAIRKENDRLRKREKEEKEKAENVGSDVSYDWKRRVLTRDGVINDRLMLKFFW